MDYYKPVKLLCSELIKQRTKEFWENSKFPPALAYVKRMPFSEEDLSVINEELLSKGLSRVKDALTFKRRTKGTYDVRRCHIDGNSNTIYNCSVVIPVSGCENTEQYWYDGSFKIESQLNDGVHYYYPVWNGEPQLVEHATIKDDPVLCRVNIPHSTYSNGKEFRITCTLRFENNETFEEIYSKLSTPL